MTPQENQLLQDFLNQLSRAQAGTKDREAQALIASAFARQPDAAYLVVQRALLLERALKQAQAQLARFQEQGSSFIGGGGSWSRAPTPASGAAPAPAYTPPAEIGARAAGVGSGWGSFLGNAAATAAGVAGGAFLFQGLENLLGHHDGAFPGATLPAETVENVTVNNYGNDPASTDLAAADDAGALSDQDLDDSGDDSSWI
jgi:hypothetical protein